LEAKGKAQRGAAHKQMRRPEGKDASSPDQLSDKRNPLQIDEHLQRRSIAAVSAR
jgi:hypothetical protein